MTGTVFRDARLGSKVLLDVQTPFVFNNLNLVEGGGVLHAAKRNLCGVCFIK